MRLDLDKIVSDAFENQIVSDAGVCVVCGSVVGDARMHVAYHKHIDPSFARMAKNATREAKREIVNRSRGDQEGRNE